MNHYNYLIGVSKQMDLFIKPRDEEVKALYENHSTYHAQDCGIDLFVIEDHTVKSHELAHTIDFGIKCEARRHHSNFTVIPCGYFLCPRSSISNTCLRMSNSIGVIDPGYRGSLLAKIDNISDVDFFIKKGTRLFQLVDPRMEGVSLTVVDELSETDRGEGGFGSTDKAPTEGPVFGSMIPDDDPALWNRIRVVPFESRFLTPNDTTTSESETVKGVCQ